MPQLTTQQRIWICLKMAPGNTATQVRRNWAPQFPSVDPPTVKTIRKNYQKYQQHGMSLNRNKGNSDRPRTVRTPYNINKYDNHCYRMETCQQDEVPFHCLPPHFIDRADG